MTIKSVSKIFSVSIRGEDLRDAAHLHVLLLELLAPYVVGDLGAGRDDAVIDYECRNTYDNPYKNNRRKNAPQAYAARFHGNYLVIFIKV